MRTVSSLTIKKRVCPGCGSQSYNAAHVTLGDPTIPGIYTSAISNMDSGLMAGAPGPSTSAAVVLGVEQHQVPQVINLYSNTPSNHGRGGSGMMGRGGTGVMRGGSSSMGGCGRGSSAMWYTARQVMPGHKIAPGHPVALGHPVAPGHRVLPGHQILPGHPVAPGHQVLPGYPIHNHPNPQATHSFQATMAPPAPQARQVTKSRQATKTPSQAPQSRQA